MKKKLVSLFGVALLSAAVVGPVFAQELDAEVEAVVEMIAKEEAAKEAKAAAEKAAAEAEKQAEKELVEAAIASVDATTEASGGALLEVLPDGSKVRVDGGYDKTGKKVTNILVDKAGLVKEETKKEETKKEETKPAAKAVAKADTKTAEKVLPKTSAVK